MLFVLHKAPENLAMFLANLPFKFFIEDLDIYLMEWPSYVGCEWKYDCPSTEVRLFLLQIFFSSNWQAYHEASIMYLWYSGMCYALACCNMCTKPCCSSVLPSWGFYGFYPLVMTCSNVANIKSEFFCWLVDLLSSSNHRIPLALFPPNI